MIPCCHWSWFIIEYRLSWCCLPPRCWICGGGGRRWYPYRTWSFSWNWRLNRHRGCQDALRPQRQRPDQERRYQWWVILQPPLFLSFFVFLRLEAASLTHRYAWSWVTGYPLPTLLRLSRLIAKELEKPLDLLMSYSHYTLQNESLKDYIPAFKRAGVRQLINASPLSMGLLRAQGPMPWHPAPPPLREACSKAAKLCSKDYDTTLERVALGFGLGAEVPVVVGLSKVEEVKECLKVRSELWEESDDEKEKQIRLVKRKELDEVVKEVRKLLEASGFMNWSWPSRSWLCTCPPESHIWSLWSPPPLDSSTPSYFQIPVGLVMESVVWLGSWNWFCVYARLYLVNL